MMFYIKTQDLPFRSRNKLPRNTLVSIYFTNLKSQNDARSWAIFLNLENSSSLYLGRLLRHINVKVWKMPWKLKFSESQYYFANIYTMEARIFMKFYVVVNYYLVNLSLKFHKDPCKTARARVLNAHTCDITCTRAFMTRARASVHRSPWNLKIKLTR